MAQDTIYVRALYPFKGTNNDELIFKQGDVITITQKEQDGWCEGTLNGKTGWFPSNYVKECKPETPIPNGITTPDGNLQSREYRNQVLKDMIESETAHVQELSSFFKTYIQTLKSSNVIEEQSYQQLIGNYEQVLTIHTQLLHKLEESLGFIGKDQRVGGMFMQIASHFKKIHLAYCANHPKAVVVLNEKREVLSKFIDSLDIPHSASMMTLTTALSKPFRRLEKYQGQLQELERHTDEAHIDRGDCQRAVTIYRDLAIACSEKRKQKEMELEVLIPGRIREWDGGNISSMGDIIHMAQVVLISDSKEKKDRYFVLFPRTLLMLSVSHRLSAFLYEGKIPLLGITVQKLDNADVKYGFEISGNVIERIVASCLNREERDAWVDFINDQICICQMASSSLTSPQNGTFPTARNTLQDKLPLKQSTRDISNQVRNSMQNQKAALLSPDQCGTESNSSVSHPAIPPHRSPTPPLPNQLPPKPIAHHHNQQSNRKPVWTMSCLRPSPPLRPYIHSNDSSKKNYYKRKVEERSYEDDMKILRVIESYCTSAKTRNTVNSALLDCPQVLIAEEEKMIVEETKGNKTVVEERSLVDTVYALKDEVRDLYTQMRMLANCIEDEKKARHRIENILKRHVLVNHEDLYIDD